MKTITRFLTEEEQQALRTSSDLRGFLGFALTWGMIVGVSALFVWQPGLPSLLLALIVLGNRQLALGILLHECAHRSWFRTPWLNDFMGHWFAGLPVLVPMSFYRKYHFSHHIHTGTEQDPDVENIRAYPVSAGSMRRKFFRDFSGQSGLKSLIGLLRYVNTGKAGNSASMGIQKQQASSAEIRRTTLRNYSQLILVQGTMAGLVVLAGAPEVLLLWWGAYLFTYPFIARVRQIAEHGAMPALSSEDVRDTTRTTLARWWERLLFAPHYVNYHCEHHALPRVPSYNLPRMHRLLKQRGFYQAHPQALAEGYPSVIRTAVSR